LAPLDRKEKIRQTIFAMKILSKVSIIFFFLFSFFFFLVSPSLAQTKITPTHSASSGQANYPVTNTNPDVPNTLHNWTQNVMIEVMSALTCQIAGVDPVNPKQSCLGADQKTGKIGFLQKTGLPAGALAQEGGAIGFMGNMISTLYTPPLHSADYFKDLAQNFGISKKTYAQQTGTGFDGLTPLIGIWAAFRNIVYLLLVIVFVVIGLAIMLRVKIDPRTVMTIQNQIPKIIIGILAVTFSFAIAGFLIDMMWVLIYLIYGIISGISPEIAKSVAGLNPASIQGETALGVAGKISTGGIFGIASNTAHGLTDVFKNLIGAERCNSILNCLSATLNPFNFVLRPTGIGFNAFDLIYDLISWTAGSAMFWKIAHTPNPEGGTPFISDIIGAFTLGAKTVGALGAGAAVSAATQYLLREAIPSIIIYLIIFIALLTALLRLWFTLLMAFVQILLAVVLAPFWIIGGIVPGSPISLSGWLKDIGSNLLAFPTVIAMFMLGNVFMYSFTNPAPGVQPFVPPLIGNPIGNPGEPSLIGSLIGLGILLITPNVVNLLKQMLKAPKTETGLGKAFAPGLAVPGRVVGGGISYAVGVHYEQVPGGAPGQMQMVAKGGAFGRILRATGLAH